MSRSNSILDQKTPLLIGFNGVDLTESLAQHLKKVNPIGVILFSRNITSLAQTAQLVAEIKNLLGDVLVGIDQEGGAVERLGQLAIPSQFALGQVAPEVGQKAISLQAGLLAHLGINLNFSPVLDLYAPASPVINLRAFSANPKAVADCGGVSIQGHLEKGVAPCPKHFPGHGRSLEDSHFSAATLGGSREELTGAELVPFQKAIDLNCPFLMSAHLWVPSLDSDLPATLSKKILSDLLRDKMGFKGLIISDCLEMAATEDNYSVKDMVKLGREAGLDLWMSSFSLKKSLGFQLELAEELNRNPCEISQKRIQTFEENRTQLKPNKCTEKEIFSLYKQSLLVKGQPLKQPQGGIIVCGLANSGNKEKNGVNAGQKKHPFLEKLSASNLPVIKTTQVDGPLELDTLIREANQREALFLLITSDGFQQSGWSKETYSLALAHQSLHIALKSPLDLCLSAQSEWGLQGYNSTGSDFLLQRLKDELLKNMP